MPWHKSWSNPWPPSDASACRDNCMTPTLDQLQVGQRGRITAVAGDDAVVQRLLEMGLLEGEEVEVIGLAPLGDPLEIRLRQYCLSLRRREAARVQVEPLAKAAP